MVVVPIEVRSGTWVSALDVDEGSVNCFYFCMGRRIKVRFGFTDQDINIGYLEY